MKKNNKALGLLRNNPVFSLYLGVCAALAVTNTLTNAISMAVLVALVLLLSNVLASALRPFIPEDIHLVMYLVIVATLVKAADMLLEAYVPFVNQSLGVFVPLTLVTCVSLGRFIAISSKESVGSSVADALKASLTFGISIMVLGLVREILATGMLTLVNPLSGSEVFSLTIFPSFYKIAIFDGPFGALVAFAVLAACVQGFSLKQAKEGE